MAISSLAKMNGLDAMAMAWAYRREYDDYKDPVTTEKDMKELLEILELEGEPQVEHQESQNRKNNPDSHHEGKSAAKIAPFGENSTFSPPGNDNSRPPGALEGCFAAEQKSATS